MLSSHKSVKRGHASDPGCGLVQVCPAGLATRAQNARLSSGDGNPAPQLALAAHARRVVVIGAWRAAPSVGVPQKTQTVRPTADKAGRTAQELTLAWQLVGAVLLGDLPQQNLLTSGGFKPPSDARRTHTGLKRERHCL